MSRIDDVTPIDQMGCLERYQRAGVFIPEPDDYLKWANARKLCLVEVVTIGKYLARPRAEIEAAWKNQADRISTSFDQIGKGFA